MDELKRAITDQKYLAEPSGIGRFLPEIEALYDGLRGEIFKQKRGFSVNLVYELPSEVGFYIRDAANRFYKTPLRSFKPGESLQEVQKEQLEQFWRGHSKPSILTSTHSLTARRF